MRILNKNPKLYRALLRSQEMFQIPKFLVEEEQGIEFLKDVWDYFWNLSTEYILIEGNNPPQKISK